ncbi:hypothetical protein N7447_010032 [Penicillium robsamsonii]|uniref:uncharacterized protein n=1 Tax=Penicillium robsamsonii TaxID=1792511 RepID=UPI0025492522|nr:uncharacterized protein N7447_010032 [Penicillium robsamsonii]KAJ5813009.1 hypothetical protein N7447_010032 [Penicillium robsamsonii]
MDDPSVRAQQTTTFVPEELGALETLTQKRSPFIPLLLGSSKNQQDESGFDPGGFVVTFAWQILLATASVMKMVQPIGYSEGTWGS